MLAKFNEEVEKGGILTQDVVGIEVPIVADKDRALVVLIGVIDGTVNEFGCELYWGRVDDASLAINDIVVSEVRHIVATRLTTVSFAV